MAQNFVDYVKEIWSSIFTSKENAELYDSERKKLEEYLSQIDRLPEKQSLPDPVKYEKMTVEDVSDDDIRKKAESGLSEYKNNSQNAIESEISELEKNYLQQKSDAKKGYDEKNLSIEKAYSEAKENASNDSLKRGLARSSIAINNRHKLESGEAEYKSKVASEFQDKIASLDNEISSLNVKREKALNDFNIAYAAKLTTSINSLKEELEDKKAEALKYNNSLLEKEQNAAITKAEKESSLYNAALNQREKENELKANTDYEAVYQKMRTMLSALPKADAKNALKNDAIYSANLSDYYYYKLYDEFAR